MPQHHYSATLLDELARDYVSDGVDVWPTIAEFLVAHQQPPHIRRRHGEMWRAAAVMTALFLSLIVLSPVRQTIADTIQHFGIMESRFTTIRSNPSAPGVTAVSEPVPMYSLEVAQKLVSYQIPQPSWIPTGFHLRGVFVDGNGMVSLSYVPERGSTSDRHGGFGLSVHPGTEPGLSGIAIPATAIQHVTVNGAPAIYARGAWEQQSGGLTWNGDADTARVAWASDGFTYLLSGSENGIGHDELLRIAESIQR